MRGWQQLLSVRPCRFATKALPEKDVYTLDIFMPVAGWSSLIPDRRLSDNVLFPQLCVIFKK